MADLIATMATYALFAAGASTVGYAAMRSGHFPGWTKWDADAKMGYAAIAGVAITLVALVIDLAISGVSRVLSADGMFSPIMLFTAGLFAAGTRGYVAQYPEPKAVEKAIEPVPVKTEEKPGAAPTAKEGEQAKAEAPTQTDEEEKASREEFEKTLKENSASAQQFDISKQFDKPIDDDKLVEGKYERQSVTPTGEGQLVLKDIQQESVMRERQSKAEQEIQRSETFLQLEKELMETVKQQPDANAEAEENQAAKDEEKNADGLNGQKTQDTKKAEGAGEFKRKSLAEMLEGIADDEGDKENK